MNPGATSANDRISASVIIPALDAESVIDRQLSRLATQSFQQFEVIVADNGGSDELAELTRRWSPALNIRHVNATARPGCGPARNVGVAAARSPALLFCDADDLVDVDWVAGT